MKQESVVILAGGKGTRMGGSGSSIPKPMMEIGGYPMLYHIIYHYRTFGYYKFIISAGYKSDYIKNWFLSFCPDLHIYKGLVEFSESAIWAQDLDVRVVNTGLNTETGGRIKGIEKYVNQDEYFLVTYGDGLSDIDINKAVENFINQGDLTVAQVTAVHPPTTFWKNSN